VAFGIWRTSGRFRVVLEWIYGFGEFSSSFVGDAFFGGVVFDVFWGLRWISLSFPWSSWWKRVNCGSNHLHDSGRL